jgi:hypothetical protein
MKRNQRAENRSAVLGGVFHVKDEELNLDLINGLRRMEYRDPPPELLSAVMRGVRTSRRPWWRRLQRWATAPRSLVVTPLQLAPVAVLLLVIGSAAVYQSLQPQQPQLSSLSLNGTTQQVKLVLTMPNVKSAAVIGSFNDWQPKGYEMSWSEDEGAWTVLLRLPKGRYEYAFVVDEEIIPDPFAGIYQEDGFGNLNAVLMVGNGHETQI